MKGFALAENRVRLDENNSRELRLRSNNEVLNMGLVIETLLRGAELNDEHRKICLKGIAQMAMADGVDDPRERAYLKKFPFTKEFFISDQELDLNAFAKRFKVKIYKFKPDLVYYLDNGLRFGFKEKIIL